MAYFKKPRVVWTIVIALAAMIITVLCLTNSSSDYSMSKERYVEYTDNVVGAIMADIDYADSDKIVFHYLDGLFVYDLKTEKIKRTFDLQKFNCAPHQQGSNGLNVTVSKDGRQALLVNYGPEDEIRGFKNYIIHLDSGKMAETTKKELENPFKNLSDTFTTLPNAIGWYSVFCAKAENHIFYLTADGSPDIKSIKLIMTDLSGNIQKTLCPFAPAS